MKATIGFGFFLLLLAGIALVALKGRQMAEQNLSGGSGAELTGTTWRPTVIGSSLMPEDSGMYITFDVDGSINGHGGCNGFFGALQQADSGIEVGPLGATRMACGQLIMTRETKFLQAVQNMRGFQKGRDSTKLLDGDGNVLAELVEKADSQ